jgi:hypothetical protein
MGFFLGFEFGWRLDIRFPMVLKQKLNKLIVSNFDLIGWPNGKTSGF